MSFYKQIKKYRLEANMTQEAFASKLGVSNKVISKWETGRGLPDVLMMDKIAKVLGIHIQTLYDDLQMSKTSEARYVLTFSIPTLISATLLAFSSALFTFYPERVPVHFNFGMQITRFGSKYEHLILIALSYLILISYYVIVEMFSKRMSSKNKSYYNISVMTSTIVTASIQIWFSYVILNHVKALSLEVNFMAIMNISIGLMLIIASMLLKFAKYSNPWFGIRTSFAFQSPTNWQYMQYVGKHTFILSGFILMFLALISNDYIYQSILITFVLFVTLVMIIYFAPKKFRNQSL